MPAGSDETRNETWNVDRAPAPARSGFGAGVLVGCALAVLVPALLVGAGVMGLGLLTMMGVLPDTVAVPESELRDKTHEFLITEGLADEGEPILYFYSDGLLSLREDGNLFTDRRAVSYWEEDETIRVQQAEYHEIADLSFAPLDGFMDNSTITVERWDESSFFLVVSNDEDRDEAFFELLHATWKARRNGDPARPGADLSPEQLAFLRAENLLAVDESVLYFYAKTAGSPRADGNLFTDRRVLSYFESEGEFTIEQASFDEITSIEPGWGAGRHGVTTVVIELGERGSLELWVSPEDQGDEAFVALLTQTWEAARSR